MFEQAAICKSNSLNRKLNIDKNDYFYNIHCLKTVRNIFKVRCGVLNLNHWPWKPKEEILCPLWDPNKKEDLEHFIGRCPILKEIRVPSVGKAIICQDELILYLNGKSWVALNNSISSALNIENLF